MGSAVTSVHHSGITVKNLQESVKFYEEVFGFRKMGECEITVEEQGRMKGARIRIAFMKAGEGELELLEYVLPKRKRKRTFDPWDTGVQHLSFKSTGVRDFYERHKDTLFFLTAPVDYKTDEIDTTWTYLKDPNGTILELSEDHGARGYRK